MSDEQWTIRNYFVLYCLVFTLMNIVNLFVGMSFWFIIFTIHSNILFMLDLLILAQIVFINAGCFLLLFYTRIACVFAGLGISLIFMFGPESSIYALYPIFSNLIYLVLQISSTRKASRFGRVSATISNFFSAANKSKSDNRFCYIFNKLDGDIDSDILPNPQNSELDNETEILSTQEKESRKTQMVSGQRESNLNRRCLLCKEKQVEFLFSPCSHAITCKTCAEQVKMEVGRCPVCRKYIQSAVKMFYS